VTVIPVDTSLTSSTDPAPGGTLRGTSLNDTLSGGAASEILYGFEGDDLLMGNDGDDTLVGGQGADRLIGGAGTDTGSYQSAATGVTVDLLNNAVNTGEAAGDLLFSVENLIGSRFNDMLRGSDGMNVIEGGDGNDQIFGRGGMDTLAGGNGDDTLDGGARNDVLIGGAGNDVLIGGADRDTFVFLAPNQGTDRIMDFQAGLDKIELGAGFNIANGFNFVVGSAATSAGASVVYNPQTGALVFDADGNGAGAGQTIAILQGAPQLTLNDFIF
jgi:Ca2+-binding RTX toxin-like protein